MKPGTCAAYRSQRGAAALAVLLILAVVGFGWSSRPSTSPSAALAALAAGAAPEWRIELTVSPESLRIGKDSASLRVTSARSGYLTLLQAGTDGKTLDVIFPNGLDKDNQIQAGVTQLPRSEWRLAAGGPAGLGALLALVTSERVDTETLRMRLLAGGLAALIVPYGAAIAAWTETDNE